MKLSKSRQHLKSFLEENQIFSMAEELFEYVPGLLFFIKDDQRRFVYVNQGLSDMFGLARKADIIGKYDTEYCDDYVESMFREDDEAILQHGTHIRNKIELVTTMDGVLKWHITTKVPLYARDGKIRGIAGITREFKGDRSAAHQHPALGKVVRFINEHYAEELSTTKLASVAGVSISSLGRNFKKTFHMTPAQYINRYRVQEACRLLSESDQPIASIASDCGFYDQSHFNRTFRNIIHVTPGSYRKRYQA